MPKVAVASTDGKTIDEHFGRAKEFLIYQVNEDGYIGFLERRENSPENANEHHSGTAKLLADVEVVLANRIGPGAEDELRRNGVIAFAVSGSIDKALTAYAKNRKLLKNNALNASTGCQPRAGSCGCSGGCK